jgi:ELWxxDGT repeat protein
MKNKLLSVFTFIAIVANVNAQTPVLIEDINLIGNSSSPGEFYEFNGKMYFSAYNEAIGYEFYSYDDNEVLGSQVELVANIGSYSTGSNPTNFLEFNGKLYFSANGSDGVELFEYDGTNTPSMVADINIGSQNSNPTNLIVFNSKLFFFAQDGGNNRELWSYDGISAPQMAYNLNASGSAFDGGSDMIVHNSKLYMTGTDGSNSGYFGVYEYDDSGSAPTLVSNSGGTSTSPNHNPSELFSFQGDIYFEKPGVVTPSGVLWKYNMTTSVLVSEDQTDPASFATINNKLVYRAYESLSGYELYEYDGSNTPSLVLDIYTGNANGYPNLFTLNNGVLYFSAEDDALGNELFQYDGINTPTMVYDFYTGTGSANIYSMATYNGNLIYTGANETFLQDHEIIIYDGTNTPEYLAECAEINPGNKEGVPTYRFDHLEFNGAYYFFANNGNSGVEVWKYDGVNTALFADLYTGSGGTSQGDFAEFNGELYIATSGDLWKTDGISAPTVVASGACQYLTVFNSKLYYKGYLPASGEELWVYDGTNAPSMVADLEPGASGFRPENLTVADGLLYFTNGLGTTSDKVWSYNGINTPTQLPGNTYDEAHDLTAFGNKLYFTSDVSTPFGAVSTLWKVDGALAPYVAITDLYGCYELGVYNNQLVYDGFILSGVTPGPNKLFLYSGSGTATEIDQNGYQQGRYFTQAGNDLYFSGGTGSGYELWKYSGTGLPEVVTSLGTSGSAAFPKELHEFNGNLMFSAISNNLGRELYVMCEIDISTTIVGTTITANESGAAYQWVDCSNGNMPILGETSQTYTPIITGNYACIVNNGSCETQTSCETISLGLNEQNLSQLTVYPNPVQTELFIVLKNEQISQINIMDLSGKIVESISNMTSNSIDVSNLETGVYILAVYSHNGVANTRFIKQ